MLIKWAEFACKAFYFCICTSANAEVSIEGKEKGKVFDCIQLLS